MGKHSSKKKILAAGHICLDVIPELEKREQPFLSALTPGALIKVGKALTATGGSVANTGLALHRLGAPVSFLAKVGDDAFGKVILQKLADTNPEIPKAMIVDPDSNTSYSVVISPPEADRIFLHHPGANDTFCAGNVPAEKLAGAGLIHFGYPPLMECFYKNEGAEMRALFEKAKVQGLATSLDMSMPDPDAESGKTDWAAWLRNVLPLTDFFLPSLDELQFMLRDNAKGEEELAAWCLKAGAAAVMLKCGAEGLFFQSAPDSERWERILGCIGVSGAKSWNGRQLAGSCFQVDVAGATGAGDCTIAGFLDGFHQGYNPERCLQFALAVGAFNVETLDAVSGIPARQIVLARIAAGWPVHEPSPDLSLWNPTSLRGILAGPDDSGAGI